MSSENLGLNEAALVINKINFSGPLDVLYQTNECYGCPLIKLTAHNNASQQEADQRYVVSTKYSFQLELRQPGVTSANVTATSSSGDWCRLQDVSLNSQGQYRIEVSPRSAAELPGNQSLICSLKTLDSGECLLCPFAILFCLLFAMLGIEQLYTQFWLPKRRRAHYDRTSVRKLSTPVGTVSANGIGQIISGEVDGGERDCDSATSATSTHDQEPASGPDGRDCGATSSSSSARRRIECLDIFRGLTITGMIFVNYGGAGYTLWEHTPWDGITPADFVFPFFIFSMGASVAISVKSLLRRTPKSLKIVAQKIFRRSAILALLGICLNSKWINYEQANGMSNLRLTGVLQRFSISYLAIAFMYTFELTLNKWIRAQSLSQVPYLSKLIAIIFELLMAFNYVAIYVYLTFFFEYDSQCPVGYVGPGGQTEGGRFATCTGGSAAWLDRTILGTNHLYNDHEVKQIFMTQVSHDPEGILGYATSILLTLIGLQCGKILTGSMTHKQKLLALGQWSIALMLASSLVLFIPINKRLWSLTFVIVTALAANLTMTLLYVLTDVYSFKKTFFLRLISSAGKNSIFLYVGHSLISGMLPWWFPISDQSSHLQLLIRLSWATFIWLLAAHYMALKGIFIRI